MSQSPTETANVLPGQQYLDSWGQLAKRIQQGSSFSGRERNCCFLNTQTDQFADVSSAIGLDQIDDSRAVATVDWDHDGDLDLWLANRTGPRVRFLRNDMPRTGQSLAIRLVGDVSLGSPRDAIGARVTMTVKLANGETKTRMQTLSAGDAFLSQSSKWMLFAVNASEAVDSFSVRWPGSNEPERFAGVDVGGRHLLRQGTATAEALEAPRSVRLIPREMETPAVSDRARVRLSRPPLLSDFSYRSWDGGLVESKAPYDCPRLIVLWASWCPPCLSELGAITESLASRADVAVDVVALNIEALDSTEPDVDRLQQILSDIGFNGESGLATTELVAQLNALNQDAVYRKRSLPLPSSVLMDHGGWVRAIYKGAIEPEVLLFDLRNLRTTEDQGRNLAIPFAGRWGKNVFVTNPMAVTAVQMEQGYHDEARDYLQKYLAENPPPPTADKGREAALSRVRLADIHHQLAVAQRKLGQYGVALSELQKALAYNREHVPSLMDAAAILRSGKKLEEAYAFLTRAKEVRPDDASIHNKLGVVKMQQKEMESAVKHFGAALRADPNHLQAANNLSWLLSTSTNDELRDGEMAVWLAEKVCKASSFRQPQALDTYAAALAEAGEFEKAVEAIDNALRILQESDPTTAIERMMEKLAERKLLYSSGEPLRD